jgi:hypothetical protein
MPRAPSGREFMGGEFQGRRSLRELAPGYLLPPLTRLIE